MSIVSRMRSLWPRIETDEPADLRSWRDWLVNVMIILGAAAWPLTMLATFPVFVAEKRYWLIAFDIAVWLLFIVRLLIKGGSYQFRALFWLAVLYWLTITYHVVLGPHYARSAWLVSCAVMAVLLFGTRAAAAATALNTAMLMLLYWSIGPANPAWAPTYAAPWGEWAMFVVNVSAITLLTSLPVGFLLNRLGRSLDNERKAHQDLLAESERLGVALAALQREMNERQRAEQELHASERRFRALIENISEVIALLDADGTVRYASPAVTAALGYADDELTQENSFDLIHPDDLQRVTDELAQVLSEPDVSVTSELRIRHQDGAWHWIEATANNMLDEPSVKAIVVNYRDVTERKQAEAEILRLQHLLQNITDSMPSALITLDPAGHVLTWNPAAWTLTGHRADQVRGQLLWKTCPELERYRDLFEDVLREGEVAHRHGEQLTTPSGAVYRDVSVFPLIANDIEGAVLRIDNATRRVQLEEMMLQSAKMASVGGLAAGVAHEINNPLGVMMQSAQMLQMAFDIRRPHTRERLERCGVVPEELNAYLQERDLNEYLEGIREAGRRAAKIVADLLSFSRRSSSDAAPHDLNTLVEQTLKLAATDYDLKKKYDFRDIEIVRELAPDLPQVACDGQQIQQVVLNLVRNAAQAMASCKLRTANGERPPRLTLRTSLIRDLQSPPRDDQSMIRLEVEDNGPGIPEAARARLFEPFFTTKAVGEGTGLGLWLCWSIIVERHHGRIWVEPVVSGGSCFVVELQLAQGETHVNQAYSDRGRRMDHCNQKNCPPASESV